MTTVLKKVNTVFMSVVAALFLSPIVLMVLTSFKPEQEVLNPASAIPKHWTLSNYQYLLGWSEEAPFGRWLLNSFFVSTTVTLLVIVFSSMAAFAITPYDAEVLTGSQALADYFEAVVKAGAPGKSAANWMQTELLRRLKDAGKEIETSPVSPAALAGLLKLVESGKITGAIGKKVFPLMFDSGRGAAEIVASEGLAQSSDTSAIEAIAREVIEKNADNVAKFKAGNEGVFKFFVGQVIKATRGQANPQVVNDVLRKLLS